MAQENVTQSHPTPEQERECVEAQTQLLELAKVLGIKPAETFEELLGPETGQSQEEIQAEVDDFLRLRCEWRNELASSKLK